MPLFDFYCDCGFRTERLLGIYDLNPICPNCSETMRKIVGANVMVKMKGEGGYPSRRKQIFNTTYRIHPKLS